MSVVTSEDFEALRFAIYTAMDEAAERQMDFELLQ